MEAKSFKRSIDRHAMPSLIRMLIVLIFLGGLVLAGMVAVTVFVTPQDKVVTIKLPARDLFDGN